MLFAQCDDMVDAFATDRSDHPLGKTVLSLGAMGLSRMPMAP